MPTYHMAARQPTGPAQIREMVGAVSLGPGVAYTGGMTVATYPGSVSPIRGLEAFAEAERDVWYGREVLREQVARQLMAEGTRAVLLFGEHGVGKTSLLRAGLIPYLRDHGVVAMGLEDGQQPAASLAQAMTQFGLTPQPGEAPIEFLARAVSTAVAGQQFVFVIDDADEICADAAALTQLADVFTRTVTRGGGRARFLFAARADRVATLGALEVRTGSLFPPKHRIEMPRLPGADAAAILDRMLALGGVATSPQLAGALVRGTTNAAGVLPAWLQVLALAARERRVESVAALEALGGPRELVPGWLAACAKQSGDERLALRVLMELIGGVGGLDPVRQHELPVRTPAELAQALEVSSEALAPVLAGLGREGLLLSARGAWRLGHAVLLPHAGKLVEPLMASLRRGNELIEQRVSRRERLRLSDLRSLHQSGIAPSSLAARELIAASQRHYLRLLAVLVAAPMLLLCVAYIAMLRRGYVDIAPAAGGDRVVVRAGRHGLRAFHWLPAWPGFGEVVSDLGLTRPMVAPEQWKRVRAGDVGGARADADVQLTRLMTPLLATAWDYAATTGEAALASVPNELGHEDFLELLYALRPLARGSVAEVKLVDRALASSALTVQRAGVAVAGAAASRQPDVYQETLRKALASEDAELRRIAVSAVRALGPHRARLLLLAALAQEPAAPARRDLLIELSTAPADDQPAPASAASVLGDPDSSAALRERARTQLRAGLRQQTPGAVEALVGLLIQERAPVEAQLFAIQELMEIEPLVGSQELIDAVRRAYGSRSEAVRAMALPLYARVDPARAGVELVTLLETRVDNSRTTTALRVAAAHGWGELVAGKHAAAEPALLRLLRDDRAEVRAAAAAAFGRLGRVAQDPLIKMVKKEAFVVAVGAAEGLAATATAGASVNVAVDGIAQLWKQKGRGRRAAARIYAQLARKKPVAVMNYLVAASRMPDDPSLHIIGVEGLCHAASAGLVEARRGLARAVLDASADVRRRIIRCVAEDPAGQAYGVAIAAKLVHDPIGDIRSEAARILAVATARRETTPTADEIQALVALVDDASRDVRLTAVHALATLHAPTPAAIAPAITRAFERADEGEKLVLLRAAKHVGATELITMALADGSATVRAAAVDAALLSGQKASEALTAAMADVDVNVRRVALERLSAPESKLPMTVVEPALALASRDANPELAEMALITMARVVPKEGVATRLRRSLASREERQRAQAAAAAIGLVARDAELTRALLEPLLEDPSRDVRTAMLPALATAYAAILPLPRLQAQFLDTEAHAMRRLVLAAAFVVKAQPPEARAQVLTVLDALRSSTPMVRATAKLLRGLITHNADGLAFLQLFVP